MARAPTAYLSRKAKCLYEPAAGGGGRRLFVLLPSLQIVALVMLFGSVWMPSAGAQSLAANPVQRSPVRGVVRASAEAIISTNLVARVAKVGFREGGQFAKGDVLVEFDCRRHKAELASAEAYHREMQVAFDGAAHLKKLKAGSRQDVETARARADRATADVDAIRVKLDQCTITAPFDGRIAELDIHEHETPATGKQLLVIVAIQEPRIELIVPSMWLTWLKPGAEFQFQVDDTGQSHDGVVTQLGATVDTVSQTIKVFADFAGLAQGILPGMSGTAQFSSPQG